MGRAKFILLSYVGHRLCYCRGYGKDYVTVVGRARLCYSYRYSKGYVTVVGRAKVVTLVSRA